MARTGFSGAPGISEAEAAALIATHAGLATVHQNAPTLISNHAGVATAHQDAPTLISDHAGVSDAHHTPATSPKVKLETRSQTASSGDVSYTGYGFQPTGLIILTKAPAGVSIGTSEPALVEHCLYRDDTGDALYDSYIAFSTPNSGQEQKAVVKTYNADGFTLTWTKVGTPPGGTLNLHVFAFK